MLLDGAIGAAAGFAGGSGAGSKSLTHIGYTNVKRTWETLTHQGLKAAGRTLVKGITYFSKNARHIVKPLFKAVGKSSMSVIINNSIKQSLF